MPRHLGADGRPDGRSSGRRFVTRDIRLHRWTDLDVKIIEVDGRMSYRDPHTGESAEFDYATWTSPLVSPGFAATQIIPSWIARTPPGTWVQVDLRFTTAAGTTTGWYVLGRWAEDGSTIRRTTVPDQKDTDARVGDDTVFCADGHEASAWQMRVLLLRRAGSGLTPVLHSAGAVASRVPARAAGTPAGVALGSRPLSESGAESAPDSAGSAPDVAPASASRPALALGRVLPVPQFSQRVHRHQNPEWNGGGGTWCSPTSVSMAAAYWGCPPDPADYAWVTNDDPWVNEAAGRTYDHAFKGCGNWAFNTAYAGRLGLDGFVTRLRSLGEVEQFIAAGIPLVLSVSYRAGQVPGADYDTNGHLLMVAGFTATGDPVVNDPAADDNAAVRKVFGRAELEAAWLNASGGVVYVIRPPHRPLPAPPAQANW
jgi:Peptidase_C39 like family